jgi:tRNA(Arg) A34 adenosine deaminase TadA
MAGIRAYAAEVNERKRLRMAARPLLQLIGRLMSVREQSGGAVQLEHVRAHSQAADIHSVGNRLTDYQANLARARPDRPSPLTLQEMPLAECEHHMAAWRDDGNGRQVIDDVRRTAIAQLRQQALAKWQSKVDASGISDGFVAGAALLDTAKAVLACGTPEQQATLVHVATSSIQAHWHQPVAADPAARAVLRSLQCTGCLVACTLEHLASCPAASGTRFRADLQRDVLRTLASDPCTADWLRAHGRLALPALLLRLMPVPAESDVGPPVLVAKHRHLTRVMCGVFSARQANAAAKSLGFATAEDGRHLLQQLRLRCLDRVGAFFSALAARSASP